VTLTTTIQPTTNVTGLTFDDSGVTAPTEDAILTGVFADIQSAFGTVLTGTELTEDLQTPQGQLASSMAAVIGDKNDSILYICNQVNPKKAEGVFQDCIGYIYYMDRVAATATTVSCTVVGVNGTVIPTGTEAQDTNGYTYTSTADVTIGATGTATVQFQNQETGPIACATGTLTIISQQITGWDTITNPSAGTLGADEETQQDFEYRRKNSVAINATGYNAAVKAAVMSVTGVTDCYVYDNYDSVAITLGSTNYSIPKNCLYVAAVGGTASDIADAIYTKKAPGCNTTGNTSTIIYDTSYDYPYPQYTINYNIPTATPVHFAVTLQANASLPSDIITQVQSAIVSAFNGEDGGNRERIGKQIDTSRYYEGVKALNDNVVITSMYVGTSTAPTTTTVTIGVDQAPTLDTSNISVVLS